MNERDETRLRDMLDAAYKAQHFIRGKTRSSLDEDDMLSFALVRAIEIVGEAASKVTPPTRDSFPQVEWRPIIGMRNRIVHDYLNVDLNIVWEVVTHDLPKLIAALEKLLPPEDESSR